VARQGIFPEGFEMSRWLAVAVLVVAAGCTAGPGATAEGTPRTPVPAASEGSPMPSGVTRDAAIAAARTHVSMSTVAGASAGTFADLDADPQHTGPGNGIEPDRLVWAVRFGGDITICTPLGDCWSPRPATSVVFLDYATGDFLTTETLSPAP
jgi:hypothetical protein